MKLRESHVRAALTIGIVVAVTLLGTYGASAARSRTAAASPIKLGSILTITNPAWQNDMVAATNKAWQDYINKQLGGINGHPVQITSCDDKGDGATTTQCMTNLLASGVVAFVNNFSLTFGNVALPQMAAANVAEIGGFPIVTQEYTSPYVFPTTAGAKASYPSLAVYFRALGLKKLAIVVTNTPAGIGVGNSVSQLWKTLGGTSAASYSFDPTAPDYTPLMSQVAGDHPDALILAVGADAAARMIKAVRVAGIDAKIGATSAAAVKSVFDAAGSAANGIYFSFACVPSTAKGKAQALYTKIMHQYAPTTELSNQTCVAASSLQYMVRVLKAIKGPITRHSVLAQLNKTTSWGGFMTHAMNPQFATPSTPHLTNPYYTISQYNNGKFKQVSLKSVPSSLYNLVQVYRGGAWFSGNNP